MSRLNAQQFLRLVPHHGTSIKQPPCPKLRVTILKRSALVLVASGSSPRSSDVVPSCWLQGPTSKSAARLDGLGRHFVTLQTAGALQISGLLGEVRIGEGQAEKHKLYDDIWVFPKMVVPPKHPKKILFGRKSHGFVGETHHLRKHPYDELPWFQFKASQAFSPTI